MTTSMARKENPKKSRVDLIQQSLERSKKAGKEPNIGDNEMKKKLSFDNMDISRLIPQKKKVEYASVKVKQELYDQIRDLALKQGIKQPGKLINLIIETYLNEFNEQMKD